ncbi:AraC family transcriptional regulator [Sphingobacterium sp. ML3W]|uniref:helix-turn-helix domain-containing protein n=1 Tax=Sphingobacterium sp. ML3W TaxID=1538644 RepID=UPI00249A2AE8|nr:AraC family transcriptional regulator [Sphingobacterium sp. ML3W]WFA81046.1 AraC family transcriptional regulator [Sphingobacterium sp. ML3W]
MNRIPEYQPDNFKAIINVERPNTRKIFNDFFIEPLSVLDEKTIMPSLPHRKTVNDFVFISKGKLDKMVCSDISTLTSGTCMILPAYKIRTLLYSSKDIEGYYCHFSDDFITEGSGLKRVQEIYHLSELLNTHSFELDDGHSKRIEILLKHSMNLYGSDDNQYLLKLYLNTFIGELVHFIKTLPIPIFSPRETITQRFRKLITSHIQDTHVIQVYAELLHVSPNHLNKCVKITTGKTASELINEALLMEAKALLSLPQYAISEVAYSLGFEDISYFSRFFRKHAHYTPSEYRNMIGLS